MTFVRPAPAGMRHVEPVPRSGWRALERLVAADPLVNAVVASRLDATGRADPSRLGGAMFGSRTGTGRILSGAVFSGGNLIPIGGDEPDWTALAEHVATLPKVCTSIVGRVEAVTAMWEVLQAHWGPPRAVRPSQPLLVLRVRDRSVHADPRVRAMRPLDLDSYLPAASAMFTEELGISPLVGASAATYRHRLRTQIARQQAFGIVGADGRIEFKADIGAVTATTAQIQGVWVRPDLRGQGIGTAALAAVFDIALTRAPSVSLYVNDFNTAARRMYARLGMHPAAVLSTVLL